MPQQTIQFGLKGSVFGGLRPRNLQLIEGCNERLGDEPAAEAAEPSVRVGASGDAGAHVVSVPVVGLRKR